MAKGMNRVTLIGNLGKDPEVRFNQNGTPSCKLSIACNERRKDGDGWKDHTEWVPVVVYGKAAENAGQYLSKGSQVAVEGKFETVSWEDEKTKEKRYMSRVVAFDVMFLGGGKGDRGAAAVSTPPKPAEASGGFIDDDLPF